MLANLLTLTVGHTPVAAASSAGLVVAGGPLVVTESAGVGRAASFTVVLDKKPTGDETVHLTASDFTEATVSPRTLRFSRANWSTPQSVTVSGVDDAIVDGAQASTVLVSMSGAEDADDQDGLDSDGDGHDHDDGDGSGRGRGHKGGGGSLAYVDVTTTDDDLAALTVVESGGSTAVAETATSDTITVRLAARPTADVVVRISVDDASEAAVSPSQLTFSAADWENARTVTVTGVDDDVDDGDQRAAVTIAVDDEGTADDVYDAVADVGLSVTVVDEDVAGILVSGGPVILDEHEAEERAIRLASEPTGGVTLALEAGEGVTLSPSTLTFTPDDWATPQVVYLSAGGDDLDGVDLEATVTVRVDPAITDDPLYDGVASVAITVTVRDDDTAGLVVDGGDDALEEGGQTELELSLSSQPVDEVTLELRASSAEVNIAPDQLTFGSDDWQTPQVVTVTGVADGEDDGDHDVTIIVTVSDAAAPYDGLERALTLTIVDVDTTPVAEHVTATIDEDGAGDIDLVTTGDPDSLLSFVVAHPAHGSLTGTDATPVCDAGTCTLTVHYEPDADFYGADSFTYVVSDGSLESEPATVEVQVAAVNDAPVAEPVGPLRTGKNQAVDVTLAASDVDATVATLTFSISDVVGGTTGCTDGCSAAVTFVPRTGFTGAASFVARASDGRAFSAPVTVQVTVVNDAPTTSPVTGSTDEDQPLSGTIIAGDFNGDDLVVSLHQAPSIGSVGLVAPVCSGSGAASSCSVAFVYTPHVDRSGTDRFEYTVSDGQLEIRGTVTVTVRPVNDLPVVASRTVTTAWNRPVTVTLSATDKDGDRVTFEVVPPAPAQGSIGAVSTASCSSLSGACSASVVFTPAPAFTGGVTLLYTARDGAGISGPGAIDVAVANQAPVAAGRRVSLAGGSTVGLTVEATDADGDVLRFIVESQPTAGLLVVAPATCSISGASRRCTTELTYTAPATPGVRTAVMRVSDGLASVTIAIELDVLVGPNRPPVVSMALEPQAAFTNDLLVARVVSASDPDGDALRIDYVWSVDGVELRSVRGTTARSDVYDLGLEGRGDVANLVSVEVRAHDGKGYSAPAIGSLRVGDSPPVATAQAVSLREGQGRMITLEGADPDSQLLEFRIERLPDHGRLLVAGSGTEDDATEIALGAPDGVDDDRSSFTLRGFSPLVVYQPDSGYVGRDEFRFAAGDGTAWSANAAAVTVGVFPNMSQQESTSTASTSGGRITQVLEPAGLPTPEAPVKTTVRASAESESGVDEILITVADVPVRSLIEPRPGTALLDFQQEIEVVDAVSGDPLSVDDHDAVVREPFEVTFRVAASLVPRWIDPAGIVVYRDGTPLDPCGNVPCASAASRDAATGDVLVTVRTDHASDWNFAIPQAPPDTSITSAPAGVTNGGSPNETSGGRIAFSFTSSIGGATYECELSRAGGGVVHPFSSCNSGGSVKSISYDVGGLPDDVYTFQVRAQSGGVADPSPARRDVVVDRTASSVTITSGPADGATVTTAGVSFSFRSTDPSATIRCRLHTQSWKTCGSGSAAYTLGSGTYVFMVESSDVASNVATAVRTFTVALAADQEADPGAGGIGGGNGGTGDVENEPAQPTPTAGVLRVAGGNRSETARHLSRLAFPDGADVVFVASSVDYADALAAGPAAGMEIGPVLLTSPDTLSEPTAAELRRLHPRKLVVMGGSRAIADGVVDQLRGFADEVTRVAGLDRFATAAAVSRLMFPFGAGSVVVATGRSFPDALAGGLGATGWRTPVLLTETDRLPAATAAELLRLKPRRIVLVGGVGAVDDTVEETLGAYGDVERVAGVDRYETIAFVGRDVMRRGTDTVFVASGGGFADALTGVPIASASASGLLMVEHGRIPAPIDAELRRLGPKLIVVLGGEAAVSAELEANLATYVSDGTGDGERGFRLQAG